MKSDKCAPGKGDRYSCFSLKSLQRIARKYNKTNEDQINLNLDREELIDILKKKFSRVCKDDQTCWLKLDIVKKLDDDEINYILANGGQVEYL